MSMPEVIEIVLKIASPVPKMSSAQDTAKMAKKVTTRKMLAVVTMPLEALNLSTSSNAHRVSTTTVNHHSSGGTTQVTLMMVVSLAQLALPVQLVQVLTLKDKCLLSVPQVITVQLYLIRVQCTQDSTHVRVANTTQSTMLLPKEIVKTVRQDTTVQKVAIA